jgi:hypothetical protein
MKRDTAGVHATVAALQPSPSHTAPSVASSSASNALDASKRDRDDAGETADKPGSLGFF